MKSNDLKSTLEQIKAIVDQALIPNKAGEGKKARRPKMREVESKNTSLPGHILNLRTASFFKQARTAGEVHAKLQSTYFCELDRVMMALLRLQRAKKLRKASKASEKGSQKAYVW